MSRRGVVVWLGLVIAVGGLSACSSDGPNGSTFSAGSASSTGPSAAPSPAGPGSPTTSAAPTAVPSAGSAASEPATPRATAPAGSFQVVTRKLALSRGSDRPLPTTIWYPASGRGPFPVIVFSHGLTSEPVAYNALLTSWARAGFVVAAPEFPHTHYQAKDYRPADIVNQPADVSYVLTRVLALNARSGDAFAGRLDTGRVAAAGHSAGGITTIGLFTNHRDKRLDAGIVLSGEQVLPGAFAGPSAKMLFVHGKLDETVPYANGVAAYQAVPWPKALMSVTKGGHVTITKQFDPVLNTTTDFWRWSLYGDASAKGRLKGDATKGGTATLATDF